MHLECITLHHLFHACAHRLCLCSSILHQSPSSVLTQSLWLGNAEPERRWQWLLSYCVSQQSQDRCSSMLFLTTAVNVQAEWETECEAEGERESCYQRGLSVYLYRGCWLMRKQQMRQHCRQGGGEEAEPDMALWASRQPLRTEAALLFTQLSAVIWLCGSSPRAGWDPL